MINPASVMKLMNMKRQFAETHPKFAAFLNVMMAEGIEEGTILEVTVTKPGREPVTSNLKVRPSDLEMIEELKHMGR